MHGAEQALSFDDLLSQFGYLAVFFVVAFESFGVPLPGESMLIAAALYAGRTGHLNIGGVFAVAAAGAILGDNAGFWIGHRYGYQWARKYGGKIRLHEGRMKLGRYLFLRHGGKVVFFGRFFSILRTYAAFLAGTNRMEWRRFLFFNAAGGIVWAAIFSFVFYAAGAGAKSLSSDVEYALGGVLAVLVIAFGFYLRRHERELVKRAEEVLPGPLEDYEPGKYDEDELRERVERLGRGRG